MRTGRIESPLQDVPVDDHGSRKLTVPVALLARAGVHDECTSGDLRGEVGSLDPVEVAATGLQMKVDRAHSQRLPSPLV